MCTVIIFRDPQARWPLRVTANRDEILDRAATAPSLREKDGVRFWAPQDLSAGGTWLGESEAYFACTEGPLHASLDRSERGHASGARRRCLK